MKRPDVLCSKIYINWRSKLQNIRCDWESAFGRQDVDSACKGLKDALVEIATNVCGTIIVGKMIDGMTE